MAYRQQRSRSMSTRGGWRQTCETSGLRSVGTPSSCHRLVPTGLYQAPIESAFPRPPVRTWRGRRRRRWWQWHWRLLTFKDTHRHFDTFKLHWRVIRLTVLLWLGRWNSFYYFVYCRYSCLANAKYISRLANMVFCRQFLLLVGNCDWIISRGFGQSRGKIAAQQN